MMKEKIKEDQNEKRYAEQPRQKIFTHVVLLRAVRHSKMRVITMTGACANGMPRYAELMDAKGIMDENEERRRLVTARLAQGASNKTSIVGNTLVLMKQIPAIHSA